MWVPRYSSLQETRGIGVDTQTLLHRSMAMHVLRQPVLPALFQKDSVYPPRDSEALAHVGDVPHCVQVLISVCDPVLRDG